MKALPLAHGMAQALREAAIQVVMPRFGRLAHGEIEEKSPGEPVTRADCEAEARIASALAMLRPQARFVGEEAVARDPALLKRLDCGEAWIVDPIDGTANYAAGRGPFALMAALLQDGVIAASCICDPLGGTVTLAERGRGAFMNGARLGPATVRPIGRCTGIVSGFCRPPGLEAGLARLAARAAQIVPTQRCAGAEYPQVASGMRDFALYWRSLVWDHAPGVLIVEEAGGKVARLDGGRWAPAEAGGPVLIARTPQIWDEVAEALAG